MLDRIRCQNFSKLRSSWAALLLAVATLGGSGTACGSDTNTLQEVEALKTKVCACKDAACVTALRESSKGLEQKLAKLTNDEMEKALKIAVSMMECATNLGVPADGL